jgi:hypothetical protein
MSRPCRGALIAQPNGTRHFAKRPRGECQCWDAPIGSGRIACPDVGSLARSTLLAGLDGVLDEDGTPDSDLIAKRARQLVEWKPGLAKGARVPRSSVGFGQGRRTPIDQGNGTTWGAVLRGRAAEG